MATFSLVKQNKSHYVHVGKPANSNVADTLLRYVLTILSLRSVSILSLTSFLSWSSWCAKSLEGGSVGFGMDPEIISLPDLATFLLTSTPGVIIEGLLAVSRQSAETCWPSSSSSSTQRRLATEKGEVKERLDLFSLSFREELRFWWRCGDDNQWITRRSVSGLPYYKLYNLINCDNVDSFLHVNQLTYIKSHFYQPFALYIHRGLTPLNYREKNTLILIWLL